MTDQPRYDSQVFPFGNGHVEAYWRDDELAEGPCMSLYVDGVEVMRFDLDPRHPHEHWNTGAKERMYYPAGDPLDLAQANLTSRWRHACQLVGVEPTFTQTQVDLAVDLAVQHLER